MEQLNFATEGEREQTSISVLDLIHGLGFGGAQVITLKFFKLLKDLVDIRVVVCEGANERLIDNLRSPGWIWQHLYLSSYDSNFSYSKTQKTLG